MNKLFRSIILFIITTSIFTLTTFAADVPVKLTTSVSSEKTQMKLSMTQIPANTTAIQLELTMDKNIVPDSIQWAFEGKYSSRNITDITVGDDRNIIVYIVNKKNDAFPSSMDLINMSFRSITDSQISAMKISTIKLLDNNLVSSNYSGKITIVKDTTPSNPGGGGGSSGGSSGGSGSGSNTNTGGGGYAPASFGDVSAHWAQSSIVAMSERGLIKGYTDNTFRPDNNITKSEYSVIIDRMFTFYSTADITPNFPDVSGGQWYTDAVYKLYQNKIIFGKSDGKFGTNENITNQEIAVILKRALDNKGIALQKVRDYVAFKDDSHISDFAVDAVKYLYESGIINGTDKQTYNPQSYSTRAQVAALLDRILKIID